MPFLSENALNVYRRLYFSQTLKEQSPSEVHARVVKFAAGAEATESLRKEWEQKFMQMLENNEFRPNSPTLMNAGLIPNPQTSACFVGDLQDSLESIFDFDRDAGFIYAQGSGLGGNYGNLRETGAALSSGGNSSGPFAFMGKLAATAEAVKSGGRARRAAHMAMMFDDHPDIEQFVQLKNGKDTVFASMNLSVAASDKFMQAVINDEPWDLLGVNDGEIKKTISARGLFSQIITNAHKCGDPGLWFIDRTNRDNTLKNFGRIESTNPCGEQALLPRQSCALAAINVAKCVAIPPGSYYYCFDFRKLKKLVFDAVRFLDNCIDISGYPTPAYKQIAQETRPIGLGIMGLADVFLDLNLPYNSDSAIKLAGVIANTLTSAAIEASISLAREKGAFLKYNENKDNVFEVVARLHPDHQADIFPLLTKYGIRNSQWTTIAPTGSTSIACDCSQGMEPLFAVSYDKKISDSDEVWTFVNPRFKKWYSNTEWFDEALIQIAQNNGSCAGIDLIPEDVQKLWVCAHDISWQDRIAMQAALQEGISNSISSTINLKSDTSPEVIGEIYLQAWRSGCKGLTIYRDYSIDDQPVQFGGTRSDDEEIKEVGNIRFGVTHEIKTGHGKIYITVNSDEHGRPIEVFTNGGKNGSVNAANLEAMARLISIALQNGTSIHKLAKTIENINDGTAAWDRLHKNDDRPVCITSVPDAMGKIMRRFYCLSSMADDDEHPEVVRAFKTIARCDQCNSPMFHHDGCMFCPQCGSKCG